MALIACPECNQRISDHAAFCPKCGLPIQAGADTASASTDTEALVKDALTRQGKIAAIKVYRYHNPAAGLAAAKDYVDRIEASLPPGTVRKESTTGSCVALVFLLLFALACFLIIQSRIAHPSH